MIKRNFCNCGKKRAKMAIEKHYASASKMMQKIGLPLIVIDRVLCEPHNIRSSDSNDSVKY